MGTQSSWAHFDSITQSLTVQKMQKGNTTHIKYKWVMMCCLYYKEQQIINTNNSKSTTTTTYFHDTPLHTYVGRQQGKIHGKCWREAEFHYYARG